MPLSQITALLGAGALGGIVSVLGLWAVSEVWAGWQSFAFFTFSWSKLYYASFWGGVMALVYILPLTFSRQILSGVLGLAVGVVYLSAYQWNGWAVGNLNPLNFAQGEWLTLGIFALVWGVITHKAG